MKKNQCVVAIVAGVGALVSGSAGASAGADFVMESFEGVAAGDGVPGGWVSLFPGGGTGLSAAQSSEGAMSMRMIGEAFSANENYTSEKYWFGGGTTTVSASIFVESFDPASDGCAGGFVGYFGPAWSVAFGVNQLVSGGPLTLGRTNIPAETGRWYHMVLAVDEDGSRARLFVNGELIDPDYEISEPAPGDIRFGSVTAHSGCTDTGSVVTYFDGIRVQGTQCIADLTGDGVLDLADLSRFVGGFTAGCP